MYRQQSDVLRATGIILLVAIGAIHFLQIVDTLNATPLLGVAYVALIVASIALAARLVVVDDARAWAAAGLLSVAVIAGYAFTRIVGTTFDAEDIGNWNCALGLASLFVEGALLGVSWFAIASASASLRLERTVATFDEPGVVETRSAATR
jgi:hypothetical protein